MWSSSPPRHCTGNGRGLTLSLGSLAASRLMTLIASSQAAHGSRPYSRASQSPLPATWSATSPQSAGQPRPDTSLTRSRSGSIPASVSARASQSWSRLPNTEIPGRPWAGSPATTATRGSARATPSTRLRSPTCSRTPSNGLSGSRASARTGKAHARTTEPLPTSAAAAEPRPGPEEPTPARRRARTRGRAPRRPTSGRRSSPPPARTTRPRSRGRAAAPRGSTRRLPGSRPQTGDTGPSPSSAAPSPPAGTPPPSRERLAPPPDPPPFAPRSSLRDRGGRVAVDGRREQRHQVVDGVGQAQHGAKAQRPVKHVGGAAEKDRPALPGHPQIAKQRALLQRLPFRFGTGLKDEHVHIEQGDLFPADLARVTVADQGRQCRRQLEA